MPDFAFDDDDGPRRRKHRRSKSNAMPAFFLVGVLGLGAIAGVIFVLLSDRASKKTQQEERADVPKGDAPKDEQRIAEYQASMKKFIEEARSLTRAMDLLPDLGAYKKRIEALEDLYSRIPDLTGTYANHRKAAREIAVDFSVGELWLSLMRDHLRIGDKIKAESCAKNFRALAKEQRVKIDAIERAMK